MRVGDLIKLESGRKGIVVKKYEYSPSMFWVRLDGEMNIKILVQDANSRREYKGIPKAKKHYQFTLRHEGYNGV